MKIFYDGRGRIWCGLSSQGVVSAVVRALHTAVRRRKRGLVQAEEEPGSKQLDRWVKRGVDLTAEATRLSEPDPRPRFLSR